MSALIAVASVLAYLAMGVLAGRLVWGRYRPNVEPVHCKDWVGCRQGDHDQACYRWSPDSYVDRGEAAALAVGACLLWPLLLVPAPFAWLIMRKPRLRREELEAKITRLERELR